MIIIVKVDAPLHMAQGIKESLAMYLERFGDAKVLEIRQEKPRQEQMSFTQIYPNRGKNT